MAAVLPPDALSDLATGLRPVRAALALLANTLAQIMRLV